MSQLRPWHHQLLILLKTSRPVGWLASLGLVRIGMAYGGVPSTMTTTALSAVLTFPFCLYLFGMNDLADASSDRRNPRKGSWIQGDSGAIQATRFTRMSPAFAALAVLCVVPLLRIEAGALVVALLLLGWMYSARPFRLKEVPIVDGLVTAAIMIGLMGVGYASGAGLRGVPVEAVAVAPALAGLHVFASAVDESSDRAAGHRTLAVRIGGRLATGAALLLSLLGSATVVWLQYEWAIAAYLMFQPLVLLLALAVPQRVSHGRALVWLGVAGLCAIVYLGFLQLPLSSIAS